LNKLQYVSIFSFMKFKATETKFYYIETIKPAGNTFSGGLLLIRNVCEVYLNFSVSTSS
jgi:hypothetical protein